MTLPVSGNIALSDIQTEFGGSNPISISEYRVGLTPAGTYGINGPIPEISTIKFSDFYGAPVDESEVTQFPISSPAVQWIFSTNLLELEANTYSNTQIYNSNTSNLFLGINNSSGSGNSVWSLANTTTSGCELISYNKPFRLGTGKYLKIPSKGNFQLTDLSGNPIDSFRGDIIRNTGGYTYWHVLFLDSTHNVTFTTRTFIYLGSAGANFNSLLTGQNNIGSNISYLISNKKFTSPNSFQELLTSGETTQAWNDAGGIIQPGVSGSPTVTFGSIIPGFDNSYKANTIMIGIVTCNQPVNQFLNETNFELYTTRYNLDTSTFNVYRSSLVTPSTVSSSPPHGILNSTIGRPVINDSVYSNNLSLNVMEIGFANRAYTTTEMARLHTFLALKYL
jgi:hypothetical protein